MRKLILGIVLIGLVGAGAKAQSVDPMIDQQMSSLLSTYKALHAAPELSHYEEKTAAFFAKELRGLGYTVTERVGKYTKPEWTSYGVVAVLKNGAGPTVMIRTDLDALPVEEKTSLPYASTVHMKNDAGQMVPVMHACGHDLHVTAMLGTAKILAQLKDQWHGTLVIIGQPSEEIAGGARAMLADGLYTRFPKPDYALALHDEAFQEIGKVNVTAAYAMASSTSVDVKIRGIGGHGSRPDAAKDPIVLAAQIIIALQTVVSRDNSPLDPAVITVGSIHGGTKHNIIPDEVDLQITVRAYREEARKKLLAGIERVAKGTAIAAGIPEELAPIISFQTEYTPAVYNDPALTDRISAALERAIGKDNVVKSLPMMASEDFALYSLDDHQIPTMIFWVGAVDPAKIKQSREGGPALPSLHSATFAPVPEPTLRTAIKSMTASVLELMKK
ncbi:MAG TPA: amidohydrolase [Pyrinomonadaceae bacterium]|nr:amidohydrolase [Pyrinomonadaceae bacterium]